MITHRDIRDRSILRLYETEGMLGLPMSFPSMGMPPMPAAAALGSPMMAPPHSPPSNSWDPESSYFSEPEFDSDYQHQHVHKTKVSCPSSSLNQDQFIIARAIFFLTFFFDLITFHKT